MEAFSYSDNMKKNLNENIRNGKLIAIAFIVIFVVAFFKQEIGEVIAYLMIGLSVAIIAWLDGFDRGRRIVKPINIKTSTLSISETLGERNGKRVYRSYDCTGRKFELDEETYLNILRKFTEDLPFGSGLDEEFLRLINHRGSKYFAGNWIFQTSDMNGTHIFLSDTAMVQIMDSFTLYDVNDVGTFINKNSIPNLINAQKSKWIDSLSESGRVKKESVQE